jgi:hypothetical protein
VIVVGGWLFVILIFGLIHPEAFVGLLGGAAGYALLILASSVVWIAVFALTATLIVAIQRRQPNRSKRQ